MVSMGGSPGENDQHELASLVKPWKAELAQHEAYVGTVAAAVTAAGYRVAERFVEGPHVFDFPDHVIRVDLGVPTADLLWDGLAGWRVIIYPFPGATCADDLSRGLTDDTGAPPHTVLRMARILMDEAVDRWGSVPRPPVPTQTWTFFGHWEGKRVVVESAKPGTWQDARDDDGRWPEGLWAAAASGTTFEEARAAAIAEYAPDQVAGGAR